MFIFKRLFNQSFEILLTMHNKMLNNSYKDRDVEWTGGSSPTLQYFRSDGVDCGLHVYTLLPFV